LAALLISTPLAFWYVGADFTQLAAPRTVHLLAQAVRQFLPPALEPALLHQLFTLTLQTLALSILAMTMAGLGGAALSFLAARNFTAPAGARGSRRALGTGLLLFTRSLLLILRAIPASIWALIMLFVIFPGILPGALALGLYTLGVLGRLMAETVESLDDRPTRALTALGASGPQAFIYSALPRALPGFISYTLYRWEVCARETVIVGVVGAGGLGRLLAEQLSNFDYAAVAATLICFIALTMLVDVISALARRARR
jgi:phosphonate transport system permease protein